MKSICSGKGHLQRTTTLFRVLARLRSFDARQERAITDVLLAGGLAVIILLYVAMLIGLYRGRHYAPKFPPDDAGGPPIEERTPR